MKISVDYVDYYKTMEAYKKLLAFVQRMSKQSCCNLHCYSCDALELLRELGEGDGCGD